MFFVAERAADIAQVRVMRIDLNHRTAGVAVRGCSRHWVLPCLCIDRDSRYRRPERPAARGPAFCGRPRSQLPCV